MKIGVRLALGFALPVLALVVLAALAVDAEARLLETSAWVAHRREVRHKLSLLGARLSDATAAERGYALTGDPAYLDPSRGARGSVEQLVAELRELTQDQAVQQVHMDEVEPLVRAELARIAASIRARRDEGAAAAARLVAAPESLRRVERIRGTLDAMDGHERALLARREAATAAASARARGATSAVLGVSGLAAAVAALWLRRSIARPIRELARSAEALAGGARGAGAEGELEVLAAATAAIAERRKTAEEAGARAVSSRERLLEVVRDAARHVATAVAELQTGSRRQVAAVERHVSATRQLEGTLASTVDRTLATQARAALAAEVARRSEHSARAGSASVERASSVLETSQRHVDGIAQGTLALAEHVQSVQAVMDLVKDLADRTMLVALNAALEAERVGEAGTTFRVVAADIRALADRARGAAADVKRLLGEIQRLANAAVLGTEQGTRSVNAAAAASREAGAAVHELAATVAEVAVGIVELAAHAKEDADRLSAARRAAAELGTTAGDSLAASGDVRRAAHELSQLGEALGALLREPEATWTAKTSARG